MTSCNYLFYGKNGHPGLERKKIRFVGSFVYMFVCCCVVVMAIICINI